MENTSLRSGSSVPTATLTAPPRRKQQTPRLTRTLVPPRRSAAQLFPQSGLVFCYALSRKRHVVLWRGKLNSSYFAYGAFTWLWSIESQGFVWRRRSNRRRKPTATAITG